MNMASFILWLWLSETRLFVEMISKTIYIYIYICTHTQFSLHVRTGVIICSYDISFPCIRFEDACLYKRMRQQVFGWWLTRWYFVWQLAKFEWHAREITRETTRALHCAVSHIYRPAQFADIFGQSALQCPTDAWQPSCTPMRLCILPCFLVLMQENYFHFWVSHR